MAITLFEWKDRIKRYLKFRKEEVKDIVVIILVFAFIVSFREWGKETFDALEGFKNLFNAIIIMTLTVLVHISGQKIASLYAGYETEFKIWWYGVVGALILCLISKGNIWFLAAGGVFLHHLSAHRLGAFRYGVSMKAVGMVALMGPLANILLATFVKTIELWFPLIPVNTVLIQKVFIINWAYAAWSLLPIPPLDGSRLLYSSRLRYFFVFGAIVSYVLLIYFFKIYSYIWALVFGVIIWLIYYIIFERKWWAG